MLNSGKVMRMVMKAERKLKLDMKKFAAFVAVVLSVIFVLSVVSLAVDFIKYPEQYVTTWKYQLKNDLAEGKQEALDYYNETYIANGKYLFGNNYIVKNEYINLAMVTGYDVTETGIMLHTNDGNGYYIEK